MDKLYIVLPAYNEEDNIQQVIDQWYPVVEKIGEDSRLVIVNDGSRDNTYAVMQECGKTRPQFIPVTKPNGGHGATLLFAYQYALEQGADYVFQTDSDGQTLPEEFWQFWEKREEYDIQIGHRNRRQDGISRVFVTKVLKAVVRICFGVNSADVNTPFRLMSAQTLAEKIRQIPKDFNLSNVLLSVLYERGHARIRYVPITFRPRQGGVNSINLRRIFRIGVQAVKDFKEINRSLSSN
ncbi:MAG: glycosyltransferase family 2 protein [Lachnospiraceae bacterium]|nr:glycosyltransferase family 2 protein [Lachnospiraceae bacterium]